MLRDRGKGFGIVLSFLFPDFFPKGVLSVIVTVWQVMLTDFTEKFCNVLMLIEILLVLAMSIACCERGFSCMNRINTQYRSRLDTVALDSLLRIGVEGVASTEFEPQRAIALWWNPGERARRPHFVRN